MYNKLIADLKEDAEWAEANEWETPITLSDNIKQAIEAIEKLEHKLFILQGDNEAMLRQIPRWIKVPEQIPDEYTTILFISSGGQVHVGYYDSEHKSYCDMKGFRYVCTHWMLAPELPTEDENNV